MMRHFSFENLWCMTINYWEKKLLLGAVERSRAAIWLFHLSYYTLLLDSKVMDGLGNGVWRVCLTVDGRDPRNTKFSGIFVCNYSLESLENIFKIISDREANRTHFLTESVTWSTLSRSNFVQTIKLIFKNFNLINFT